MAPTSKFKSAGAAVMLICGLGILGLAAAYAVNTLSTDDCTTVAVTLADGSQDVTQTCS